MTGDSPGIHRGFTWDSLGIHWSFTDLFYSCSFIGKCIFASLIVSFRHGREEDEVMGISFKKELVVDRVQIHPVNKEDEKSKLQVHRL